MEGATSAQIIVPQAQDEDATENLWLDIEARAVERCIGGEAKPAVKQFVTDELEKVLEESLDHILCASYHNVQSGICSIVYKVAEQFMLNLLR